MVKRINQRLGRLMCALKSLSIAGDTNILFTSDYGCHFNTINDEYKRSCQGSSLRSPCASFGHGFNHRSRRDEQISLEDISPITLDALGIPIPEEIQGYSVVPMLEDVGDFPKYEQFIQISEDKVSRVLWTRRWKSTVTAFDLEQYELSASTRYKEEFFYDHGADPCKQ